MIRARRHSFLVFRPRVAIAGLAFTAITVASIAPSIAAAGDPSLTVKAIDDIVVASGRNFDAGSIDVVAQVDGGSGEVRANVTAAGRFVVAFQVPDGFTGTVEVTAGDASDEASVGATTSPPVAPVTEMPTGNEEEKPPATGEPSTGGASLASGSWYSGASSDNYARFESYLGKSMEAATVWNENDVEVSEQQWSLTGGPYQGFGDKPTINNVGGIWEGQSWAQAATGAYEAQWRTSLEKLVEVWQGKDPANMYIAVAHEANGSWFPWSIKAEEAEDFKAAFHRYRQLQQEIMPGANFGYVLNGNNNGFSGELDGTVPNAEDLDFLGVNFYSDHFDDGYDFAQFPAIAKAHGVPLVVPEWGIKENDGNAAYIQYMFDMFTEYGGSGPGQIVIETVYDQNVGGASALSDKTAAAAQKYKELWG